MSKIFDKLGIYDLVAVLLSGICMSTFSILVFQLIYNVPVTVDVHVDETILFFVLSYFLGLIFQETGSFIQKKCIYRNNRLLKDALKTSANSHIYLTANEKNGVYSYVIGKLHLNPDAENDNIIYNYCKSYIVEHKDTTRIDRDQSISSMARSLSLYFFILSIIFFSNVPFQPSVLKIILSIASIYVSILPNYRCKRFAMLRYINIFRIFYFAVVAKNFSEIE